MSTFDVDCSICGRRFKSFYSLKKHVREKHQWVNETALVPVFKDSEGVITSLPKPRKLDEGSGMLQGYKLWVNGLIERINSTFHPRLPGRWIKVDCHQVPKMFFEHLISNLPVQVNSVREVGHRKQPCYQAKTRKISYKIFEAEHYFNAFKDSEMNLNAEVLFAGNMAIDEDDGVPLSAEEEIARAKQGAHMVGRKRKNPSSKSTLIIGYGEGRATREVELIWWPDLYNFTDHGRLEIRMFQEKCEF